MNLKQLNALVAVFEEGSFSAAAQRLNIVQPALSQQIIGLERELAVQLFERTNRGVAPTRHGQRLVNHARLILRQMEIARNDLRTSLESEPAGDVIIALPVTVTAFLAPRLLTWLEEHYPRIRLHIVEGLSSESGHVVETGKVELGVNPNAAELDDVESIPVLREYFYLIGAPELVGPETGDIDLADAASRPLILGDRTHNMRRVIDEHVVAAGARLNLRFEQNGPKTLTSVVDQGLACIIANLPMPLPDNRTHPRLARRIVNPRVQRLMTVAWPRKRPLSRPAERVRDGLITLMVEAARVGDWQADVVLPAEQMPALKNVMPNIVK